MKKKITQITVRQMRDALNLETKKGNGDKYLIAPEDNEGNGYHGVFFCVSPVDDDIASMVSDSQVTDPTKLILIG